MKKYLFYILFAFLGFACSEEGNEYLNQGSSLNAAFVKATIDAGVKEETGGSIAIEVARGNLLDKEVDAGITLTIGADAPAAANFHLASPIAHFAAGAGTAIVTLNYDFDGLEFYQTYPLTLSFTDTNDNPLYNGYATCKVNVSRLCAFETDLATGDYDVVSEDWAFEGELNLEADPQDPYKIYVNGYPEAEDLTGNGNRIVLNINPEDFSITGTKVVLAGNLSEWGFPSYTNYYFQVVEGSYSPCDGTYNVIFLIGIDQGTWGNNAFTFTRK
ncbi:MAG: hypothetical protein LBT04_06340 [Prevotellaceae bacterium]|jgi:hypothetical protein|nr:hypothetical protein [Prevotellaceae bacterium]